MKVPVLVQSPSTNHSGSPGRSVSVATSKALPVLETPRSPSSEIRIGSLVDRGDIVSDGRGRPIAPVVVSIGRAATAWFAEARFG